MEQADVLAALVKQYAAFAAETNQRLRALESKEYAATAGTVDGFRASATRTANYIQALNAAGRFNTTVFDGTAWFYGNIMGMSNATYLPALNGTTYIGQWVTSQNAWKRIYRGRASAKADDTFFDIVTFSSPGGYADDAAMGCYAGHLWLLCMVKPGHIRFSKYDVGVTQVGTGNLTLTYSSAIANTTAGTPPTLTLGIKAGASATSTILQAKGTKASWDATYNYWAWYVEGASFASGYPGQPTASDNINDIDVVSSV